MSVRVNLDAMPYGRAVSVLGFEAAKNVGLSFITGWIACRSVHGMPSDMGEAEEAEMVERSKLHVRVVAARLECN